MASYPGAALKDVSHGGPGLPLDRRFVSGTVLTIDLPSGLHRPCLLLARVVHATDLPEGGCLFGYEPANLQAGKELAWTGEANDA
jgi:hypothetical protein